MNVLIRADASTEIGSGHLMRCLTLGDQLRARGSRVAFACRDLPGALFNLLEDRGYPYARLSGGSPLSPDGDAEETLTAARDMFPAGLVDWVVVDHYGLEAAWERTMRRQATKIMAIDDLADRRHDCDLLLDQNYYRDLDRRYRGLVPDTCVRLLGPSHLLLRQEFVDACRHPRARDGIIRRILVFMGGGDSTNQTQKVMAALASLGRPEIAVDVVVGGANPFLTTIERLCATMPNMKFHCQVTNIAELVRSADLAIGAGGSAMWERCYLGLPAITVVFAANQERAAEDAADAGAIEYLGWADRLEPGEYARAIAEMIGNPQRVGEMSVMASDLLRHAGESDAAETMSRLMKLTASK
jgi:UDP-2,4-diacetamido-2,4,6-trideoxy-beta-L-altropyranose hydrolase